MAKKPTKPAKPAKKPAKPVKPVKKPAATKAKPVKPPAKKPAGKRGSAKKPATEPTATASAGKSPALHAIVIGCNLYLPNVTPEGSYPSLRGCVSDATRVVEFLRQRAGLADDRLTLLTSTPSATKPGQPDEAEDRQPIYENIVGALQAVTKRAKKGDHVYLHYSGHGGRCPTIVPKVKGAGAFDEGLVPIDIGSPKARYVRDVEIAKLLREMTDKGLLVTAVLDCCHSGGATRAVRRGDEDQVGVRGVDFVDRTKRPTGSLVGTPEELAGVLPPADATRGPGQTRGLTPVGVEKTGCVVLAACRPFELAREFMFDGGPSQGRSPTGS